MLGQRRRWWTIIKTILVQCLMCAAGITVTAHCPPATGVCMVPQKTTRNHIISNTKLGGMGVTPACPPPFSHVWTVFVYVVLLHFLMFNLCRKVFFLCVFYVYFPKVLCFSPRLLCYFPIVFCIVVEIIVVIG